MMKSFAFALWVPVCVICLSGCRKTPGIPGSASDGVGRDIASMMEPMRRPAIQVKTADEETGSYFGGMPPAHEGFTWPEREGRPLGFLACIDLARLPELFDWLPREGCLLFFYDMEQQAWGFDPKDRGSWVVRHVKDLPATRADAEAPAGLTRESIVRRKPIRFVPASLPPTWEEDEVLALDSDDDLDVMWGDAGMLYFWIQADEARKGDFSNAWMILQCG